jgi:tRNA (Thr-GGU) A37 N-methylase
MLYKEKKTAFYEVRQVDTIHPTPVLSILQFVSKTYMQKKKTAQ